MKSDSSVAEVVERLRGEIDGTVLTAQDPGYDEARSVWNGLIDRQPAAIVRAGSVRDAAPTIRVARELRVPLAIRGGGHNVAGNGTVDDGLVLDLGALDGVQVDVDARTVTIEPGATLADVDRATQAHGLAVPIGVISATGMAGLTLGGGVGWLTRAHGLTVDSLLAADVVTADGATVRASETDDHELLWGLRGGGGNFGVVTSFTYRAYPLGPEVVAGTFVYGVERWADAYRAFGTWTTGLPDEMTAIATTMVPPPEWEMGDDPLLLLGFASTSGDRAAGEALVAALREAAPPDAEVFEPTTWLAWQTAADGLFPKGVRAYWKNASFDRLDEDVIEVLIRRGREQTWRGTGFDVHHMEGAYGRVPEEATPFPNRAARYWLNIYGYWSDRADDAARTAFVREFAADMGPFASGGTYVNFLGHEGPGTSGRAAALAVYGQAKLERLTALKRRLDPGNVFRLNHNIPPD